MDCFCICMANFPRAISLDMRKATVPVSPVEPIELTQKKHFSRKNLPVENYIMSNTGNLTPMDKYTFRWFIWIHRTNKSSVGEMTHGKLMLVNALVRWIHRTIRWTFKASYYKYELRELLFVCASIK